MNKLFIRLTISILVVIGINLLGLAYFIGETLLEELTIKGRYYIVVSFIASFIILSLLIYHLIRNAIKPINEITKLVKDLSEGHYWRRINSPETDTVLHELSQDTNNLAQQLQKTTESQFINENRIRALIRHMGSGLMFINQKGKIEITNQKAIDLLHWKDDQVDQLYYAAPLPRNISDMIQDAFTEDQEIKGQITIDSGINRRVLELSVAPVKDYEGNTKGIVLVFYDITDLKKLEQMRADFVANVSHELKTPLTSIKGFSETLLEGAMYSEEHLRNFLEIIQKEADRLHRLIQDLLHLSHIEQNKFTLQWEDLDLKQVLRDIQPFVQDKANDKQIQLQFEYQEGMQFQIKGDRDRIHQIFLNLITNAIQYTPEKGEVTISIKPWEKKGYVVSVADTGVGIKESEIPRIFERFYRVDKARSRASGGTGLGLAIVKHLVEVHQGEIVVESEEGKGSCFSVYLYHNPFYLRQ